MENPIFPRQVSPGYTRGTNEFLFASPRQNSERKALIDWLRRLRFLKRISWRRIRFSRILSDPFSSCLPLQHRHPLFRPYGNDEACVFQTHISLRCSRTQMNGGGSDGLGTGWKQGGNDENGWRVFVKPSRVWVNSLGAETNALHAMGLCLISLPSSAWFNAASLSGNVSIARRVLWTIEELFL